MLAGNKCDESPEIREVSAAEGQTQAAAWGVSFMETSAKTNHNVTQLFQVHVYLFRILKLYYIEYRNYRFFMFSHRGLVAKVKPIT